MPGIFGIVDSTKGPDSARRAEERAELVAGMAAAMLYDPSYVADIVSPQPGVCVGLVGWHRGPGGRTMATQNSGLVLLAAGQPLVAVGESRPETASKEFAALDGSPARNLVGLYLQYGEDAFQRVPDILSGVLCDRRANKCLLFTDRYGMERIFVYHTDDRVYFSSEAKAILAVVPAARAFDEGGLSQFLAFDCTIGRQSLFRGVEVLPGGTLLKFAGGDRPGRRTYFDRAALENCDPIPSASFLDEFSERLHVAVAEALHTPPTVGVSLTGGLDSRMIMACLDAAPGSVPCYTFGSMYRETFDVAVGRQVAAACGQPYQVIPLDRQFLTDIREHMDRAVYISDGYLGLSGAAELYVNRQARAIAPVRMTGNWGGELLRGVRAFKAEMPKGEFVDAGLLQHLRASADIFADASQSNPLSYTLFEQMPSQGYGRYAIERSQVVMRSPFLSNDVVSLLYRTDPAVRRSPESAPHVIRRRPQLLSIPTDTGLLGSGGPAATLRRLYRRASFKAEYLVSHGAPDWMASLTASPWGRPLERYGLGRHKFQHFRRWMRDELRGFLRSTLLEENAADLQTWFNMHRVRAMLDDHIAGRANYTSELDKLATVALASRHLFSQRRSDTSPASQQAFSTPHV